MNPIIASKTFVLTGNLAITQTLKLNSVPFNPDMCILRNVSITNTSTTANNSGMFYITTNITNGQICSFTPVVNKAYKPSDSTFEYNFACCISPNIQLLTNNGVPQQITFTIGAWSGTPTNGLVSLVVEFIKYK